jgi:hypothetical protein
MMEILLMAGESPSFPDAQLRIMACASGRLSPTQGAFRNDGVCVGGSPNAKTRHAFLRTGFGRSN